MSRTTCAFERVGAVPLDERVVLSSRPGRHRAWPSGAGEAAAGPSRVLRRRRRLRRAAGRARSRLGRDLRPVRGRLPVPGVAAHAVRGARPSANCHRGGRAAPPSQSSDQLGRRGARLRSREHRRDPRATLAPRSTAQEPIELSCEWRPRIAAGDPRRRRSQAYPIPSERPRNRARRRLGREDGKPRRAALAPASACAYAGEHRQSARGSQSVRRARMSRSDRRSAVSRVARSTRRSVRAAATRRDLARSAASGRRALGSASVSSSPRAKLLAERLDDVAGSNWVPAQRSSSASASRRR